MSATRHLTQHCKLLLPLHTYPFSHGLLLFSSDVLKFFGCELGAQTKFDKKAGTSIVNGAHDSTKLAELLESFIKKYVQCYSCGNPETVVKIKKESIFLKCKACGFVSEVDPRLRLNTFIVKNPPENKLSKAEKKVKKAEKDRLTGLVDGIEVEKEKKEKKDKKKKKSSSKKKSEGDDGEREESPGAEGEGGDDEDEEESEDDDDVVWMTDTSEAAMKKRAEEQLSGATAAMVTLGNVEAEREAARRKEEKAAKKKAEEEARLAEEAAKLAALKVSDPAAALRIMVVEGAAAAELEAVVKDVPGGPAARMKALFEALFCDLPEGEKLATAVTAKAAFLEPWASDAAGQLAQLVALEHLLGVTLRARVKEAPLVLKAMYDADLAEEDLILAWYNKPSAGIVVGVPGDAAQEVRAAAKPFADWLEEEDDSEDDSDEED